MSNSPHVPLAIPESYIEQIKEALENLYDFSALQRNPLAEAFEVAAPNSNTTGAHRLRRQIIEAIETLNPGHDIATHSGAARIYNLVFLHYVGGMTLQEAALEVGVSQRQAYRDLRRGQESLSAMMWYTQERTEIAQSSPEPASLSSIQTEITRLEGGVTTFPIQKMVESTVRAVQNLAFQRQITLDVQMPEESLLITTNLAIAQQVFIHLLSQVIQQFSPSRLRVSLGENHDEVQIVVSYSADTFGLPRTEPIINQMMHQIHWKIQHRTLADEQHLTIGSNETGALLLIIDDNEGLVDLLDHYLMDNSYRLVSVHNGDDGLQMVEQVLPDAIILDIMMPDMDGWELLQHLRTNNSTQHIPVIICSVINDPALAYSLGASKFVPKPVTKETLLTALQELHI
jgi:CheY-like chemotaxis protein